jgi:hypothetical protein
VPSVQSRLVDCEPAHGLRGSVRVRPRRGQGSARGEPMPRRGKRAGGLSNAAQAGRLAAELNPQPCCAFLTTFPCLLASLEQVVHELLCRRRSETAWRGMRRLPIFLLPLFRPNARQVSIAAVISSACCAVYIVCVLRCRLFALCRVALGGRRRAALPSSAPFLPFTAWRVPRRTTCPPRWPSRGL